MTQQDYNNKHGGLTHTQIACFFILPIIPVQPVLLRGWGCLLIHTRYAGDTLPNVAAGATAGRTFGNVGTSGTLGSVAAGGTVGNVATGGTFVM